MISYLLESINGRGYCLTDKINPNQLLILITINSLIVVVALLFFVHGKHLRSCRDGQLT